MWTAAQQSDYNIIFQKVKYFSNLVYNILEPITSISLNQGFDYAMLYV